MSDKEYGSMEEVLQNIKKRLPVNAEMHFTEEISKDKSNNYLEKHGILDLFEKMLTETCLQKPDDPIEYLINQFENITKDVKA
ncbi:hypothetical protein Ciccas_009652 [Cichlidogyrus casuarinus]|uniref:Uncharacterized protein n=1 Tax=Cichlidogyrus casuarinus TaxID=1844966 RepID=A0ABD2PWN5_9PLAT